MGVCNDGGWRVYGEFAAGGTFPRPEDLERLSRYSVARAIKDGRHAEIPEAKRARLKLRGSKYSVFGLEGDGIVFFVYNLPSLIVRKRVQLQILQRPLILMDDKDVEKQFRKDLRVDSPEYWARIRDGLEDSYWFGDGLLTVSRGEDNGPLSIRAVDPSRWFPVLDDNDDMAVLAHQFAWIEEHETDKGSRDCLRVDICRPGRIERRAFLLDHKSSEGEGVQRIDRELSLETYWPGLPVVDESPALDGMFPCVHLANGRLKSGEIWGCPEFKDSEGLIADIDWRLSTWSEANDRVAHQAEIVDKVWLSQDEHGTTIPANPYHRQFIAQSSGRSAEAALPQYREYQYQAEALEKQFQASVMALCIRHETAPALIGIEMGAAKESGEAKSLSMSTTEARAREDLLVTAPRVNSLFTAAARLRGYDSAEVSTHWRVGLPKTEDQILKDVVAKKNAGLMTRRDMLEALEPYLTDEQIDTRLAELEAEREAEVQFFMNDSTALGG